ncbi:hypothetical protein BO70DRAFT_351961 [Aspergillus heteromorphus CBS 117.55]|uniref:Uncharacterized protein n=1 Tax=Aspergillus heteromorphus CBS 117.55 TaxID=1448321 RepID=A0A317WHT0_9EURO|nr:uncharacterized protein BO70DRAFT_351961 [Aspergillus heteromorphus CBS 117.55]PWY84822.1 hypothetical protein BO70DRAFT_351961 [Aspergillus heteromorphus CBS 117.55]
MVLQKMEIIFRVLSGLAWPCRQPRDLSSGSALGIRPAILGYDFCGKVLTTPPDSHFRPGDIIAGYTPTGIGRPAKYGTHQSYTVCPEGMAFLASVAGQRDPGFKKVFAMRNREVVIHPDVLPRPIVVPAREEDHRRA